MGVLNPSPLQGIPNTTYEGWWPLCSSGAQAKSCLFIVGFRGIIAPKPICFKCFKSANQSYTYIAYLGFIGSVLTWSILLRILGMHKTSISTRTTCDLLSTPNDG